MIAAFIEMLSGAVFDVLRKILSFLPAMPFSVADLDAYLNNSLVVQMISWMNYLLPIGPATAMISLWATAMMAYVGIKMAVKYSNRIR